MGLVLRVVVHQKASVQHEVSTRGKQRKRPEEKQSEDPGKSHRPSLHELFMSVETKFLSSADTSLNQASAISSQYILCGSFALGVYFFRLYYVSFFLFLNTLLSPKLPSREWLLEQAFGQTVKVLVKTPAPHASQI